MILFHVCRYDSKANIMLSSSKNIAVQASICVANDCTRNCNKTHCELCIPCLSSANLNSLHKAYRENVRRGNFKRIFPSKVHFSEDFISKMSLENQISTKWFKAKCEENSDWC